MRIGIIVYGLDRPLTGIGRYTLELVKALATLQPHPDIVLLGAGRPGPLAGNTPFPWHALPGCRLLPGLLSVGNIALARAAKLFSLDVIHDPTGVAPFLFSPSRFRTILTLHDVFPWSFPGYSTLMDRIIYRHWLPHVIAGVDAVITVSRHSQQDIHRFLGISTDVITPIYPGVSSTFAPTPAPDVNRFLRERFGLSMPYLLYVGALTPRKNIGRILEAFALLRPQFPELRLVIAGSNGGKQVPLSANQLSLVPAQGVIYIGAVSDMDLAMLYCGARLFLFPSLYEGFGLPVIEAMACGTPVLTSDRSSLPEVAGGAALIVDALNVAGMVEAVRRVLVEPDLASWLSEQGRARAAAFTWERAARETVQVYQRVMTSA